MERYYAKTTGSKMAVGCALSIRSGVLRPGDLLDIHLSSGQDAAAEVDDIGAEHLRLRMNGRIWLCRPWRTGDAGVDRLPGTVSNWTVERVDTEATIGID